MNIVRNLRAVLCLALLVVCATADRADAGPAQACIDGSGPGWVALSQADFANVNCQPDTWKWGEGIISCSGNPVGVIRTIKTYTNFEAVVEWRHLQSGGNSGVFIWATQDGMTNLPPGRLPQVGIEVQILDHGYREQYERSQKKKADWFTTNGDVFPVGRSKLNPFSPVSPNGQRSFPRKELSKGFGQWNHYYIRAINGEVRLWVNGEEVSGGNGGQPAYGHLCLESEGAPIEFRNLLVRELP